MLSIHEQENLEKILVKYYFPVSEDVFQGLHYHGLIQTKYGEFFTSSASGSGKNKPDWVYRVFRVDQTSIYSSKLFKLSDVGPVKQIYCNKFRTKLFLSKIGKFL